MTDNLTGLDRLPTQALAVAARAGAHGGPVEQLRTDLARTGTATQSSTDGAATAELALDADTDTDTRTLSEAGAWWQANLGAVRHVRQVEIWNDASSTTADFDVVTDDGTVHVSGKALRPTLVNLDSRTRTVKIVKSGTGRVALAQVLIHP
ncbi:hypothetical protein [Streptomyces sp. ITFR-6]|uniref:hypothetical protein n=1 Tax=Streptomyces sp. ITFR-6 TaxID=3075197 RepID=UPI00288C55E1|nr:hypothetical protein [Streptomyces sp. ITFR-6]WNI27884.1 hypothetical protein RLT59_03215 [Streptomyces sp. ITFR-6]